MLFSACLDNYAAEGLRTSLSASDVVAGSDIIVIAVKPYTVRDKLCLYISAACTVRDRMRLYISAVYTVRDRMCLYISAVKTVRDRVCLYIYAVDTVRDRMFLYMGCAFIYQQSAHGCAFIWDVPLYICSQHVP